MRTLIGGVGYRWQRDGSLGLVAVDELKQSKTPAGVEVADLGYGAILAAQDLADARPPYDRLILLAGTGRGRQPGAVACYRYGRPLPPPEEIQERIREAGAGIIDIDHLLVIAQYFNALPREVLVIEVEPVEVAPGVDLSPRTAAVLRRVLELVRTEAVRPPWTVRGNGREDGF